MLDERHFNVAGQQGKLDGAQFIKGPTLPATTRGDGFVPHRGHFLAQRLVADLHQTREELRDFIDTVAGSFRCCHGSGIDSNS